MCILPPPSEYDGMICVATAVQGAATITVVTCKIFENQTCL